MPKLWKLSVPSSNGRYENSTAGAEGFHRAAWHRPQLKVRVVFLFPRFNFSAGRLPPCLVGFCSHPKQQTGASGPAFAIRASFTETRARPGLAIAAFWILVSIARSPEWFHPFFAFSPI